MEERNENKREEFRMGTQRCGVMMGLLGAVIALMLIFLGFWRTLFVAVFVGAGYFLGAYSNKSETVKTFINRLFPPKSN